MPALGGLAVSPHVEVDGFALKSWLACRGSQMCIIHSLAPCSLLGFSSSEIPHISALVRDTAARMRCVHQTPAPPIVLTPAYAQGLANIKSEMARLGLGKDFPMETPSKETTWKNILEG